MMGFTPIIHRTTREENTRWVLGSILCVATEPFTPDVRPREMKTRGKKAWRDSGEGCTASWNVAARQGELCQD